MASSDPNPENKRQRVMNLTLAALAGQVGCLTLIIIGLAVIAGVWLDNQFDTKPAFTIALIVASIPVSVLTMLFVARKAIEKMKSQPPVITNQRTKEGGFDEEA